MKGLTSLLICLLLAAGPTNAFTTKKPAKTSKRHSANGGSGAPLFTATGTAATVPRETTVAKKTAAVLVSSSTKKDHHHFEMRNNEEPLVSPGTAALACLLTIAVGFGLGYGT
jgi:hypothetical protein